MARTKIVFALLSVLPCAAVAQSVNWSVVAAEHRTVPMPPLQTNLNRQLYTLGLADTGRGRYGFWSDYPQIDVGLWTRTGTTFTRYARLNSAGPDGPGRVGADANHVFLRRYEGYEDIAPDGRRVFLAQAGDAAAPAAASVGAWSWNGTANVEIARMQASGPLGPGLGANWYIASGGFHRIRALPGGGALYDVQTISPTTAQHDAIVRHVPGQGNVACALSGSTDPALAPGIVAGDTFPRWYGSDEVRTVDAQGRAYGLFDVSGSRGGIFELCNGAPRALAVDEVTGVRGPGLASPSGTFYSLSTGAVHAKPGIFYFFATAREAPNSAYLDGIFRHDGTRNRPVALEGDTGAHSPNWSGSVFQSFAGSSLDAAGNYATFSASVNAGGTSASGLWRARIGGRARPAAIIGAIGELGPQPGLTWEALYERAIFTNGDIVVHARTSDNVYAIWLLREGQAPQRILRAGDVVTFATVTGTVQSTVQSFDVPANAGSGISSVASRYASGFDNFAAADGSVLVRASLTTYGTAWIVARPTEPGDHIFKDGHGD